MGRPPVEQKIQGETLVHYISGKSPGDINDKYNDWLKTNAGKIRVLTKHAVERTETGARHGALTPGRIDFTDVYKLRIEYERT